MRYGRISAFFGFLMILAASAVIAARGRHSNNSWRKGGIVFIVFGLLLMSKFLFTIGKDIASISKKSRPPYNPTVSPVTYGYPYDYGPQPDYGPPSPQPGYGPPSQQPGYGPPSPPPGYGYTNQ